MKAEFVKGTVFVVVVVAAAVSSHDEFALCLNKLS